MSTELATPSRELAQRLLAEVSWDERLTGVTMQCLSGPTSMELYSLDQAAAFLRSDELEHLKDPMSGASYGYIDPEALTWWLDNIIDDHELARAIESAAGECPYYLGQLQPMQDLLVQRLRQAEEVVAETART